MRALLLALLLPAALFSQINVRDFGARADGLAKDTAALQRAIDAASAQGGGTVTLPAGRYLSGTLHLRSGVTLHLDNGATLLASPDNADFDPPETLPFTSVSDDETTYFHYALISAENVHNIAITGQGIIDGNRTKRGGPKPIAIKLCQHVSIDSVTVQNAPNYAISLWGVDYATIDRVTILNAYADGIDPDSSSYVRISNSYIDSHDDAICPKASPSMGMDRRRPVEHLTVTNCHLRTDANNFKFGTESSGDFRDITVSNITMAPRANGRRPISGISLESVDGSNIDGVAISNVTMQGLESPIFIRLANRGRGLTPRGQTTLSQSGQSGLSHHPNTPLPTPGSLRNVSIQNVVARDCSRTSSITGLPGHPVQRVSLSNLQLGMTGGGAQSPALDVPEHPAKYPQANMFGPLPAHALYLRHAEGLSLSNIRIFTAAPDQRPALISDDVSGLDLDNLQLESAAASAPVLWLHNTRDAFLRNTRAPQSETFLRLSGPNTAHVTALSNDLTRARRPFDTATAPPQVLTHAANALPPAPATSPNAKPGSPGRSMKP